MTYPSARGLEHYQLNVGENSSNFGLHAWSCLSADTRRIHTIPWTLIFSATEILTNALLESVAIMQRELFVLHTATQLSLAKARWLPLISLSLLLTNGHPSSFNQKSKIWLPCETIVVRADKRLCARGSYILSFVLYIDLYCICSDLHPPAPNGKRHNHSTSILIVDR